MHDNTLCVINLDNSGSMGPGDPNDPNIQQWDYAKAVKGAKVAVEYIRDKHINPSKVDCHLWMNDCPGVRLIHKTDLGRDKTSPIPDAKWVGWPVPSILQDWTGVYGEG